MRICILVFVAFFITSNAYGLDGFISFGFGSGGSNLSQLTGGQDYDIHAGDGLFISGGLIFSISPTHPHRSDLFLPQHT